MGGNLIVNSSEGKGTSVFFCIKDNNFDEYQRETFEHSRKNSFQGYSLNEREETKSISGELSSVGLI